MLSCMGLKNSKVTGRVILHYSNMLHECFAFHPLCLIIGDEKFETHYLDIWFRKVIA